MLTSSALLAPHLPTLVEDQHRGHATPMLVALEAVSQRLLAEAPQAVVVLSTRWNAPGPFRVDAARRHRTLTDYTGMGVVVRYDCNGHPALARALVEAAQRANLSAGSATRGVDSGVSVPLHFLVPDRRLPVVPLSLPHRPVSECRQWGALLRRVLEAWPERVAFVVGGVLSYNLHAMNLRRDLPESRELDAAVLDALTRGAWGEVGRTRPAAQLAQAQPEAALRHLEVLRGFLGADLPGKVLAYDALPGVGAALVEFSIPAVAPVLVADVAEPDPSAANHEAGSP